MEEDKEIIDERLRLINILIGYNVAKARVSAGISGEELGKRIGVRQQQVRKYESGINAVPPGRLVMIAEELEVELLSLFKYTFNITNVRKKLCINASRDFTEIQDEDEQRAIHKIIKETLDNQK